MNRQIILNRTFEAISKLPIEKLSEVDHYATFLLKMQEEESIRNGIKVMAQESNAFDFLNHEEDLYTIEDLKIKFR